MLTRFFTIIAIVCVKTNYLNIVLIGVHIKSTMRARFARHVLTKGKRHSGDCCRSAAVIDGNMKRCGRSRRTDEEICDGGRSGSSAVCGDVWGLRSDDNEGEGGVRYST